MIAGEIIQTPVARQPGIGSLFRASLRTWAIRRPRRISCFARIALRLWLANRRRIRSARKLDAPVPYVVALSPTMRCNYNCGGCYSRRRSQQNELSTAELNSLFSEAEDLGVLAFILLGGEPLMRPDLLGLIERHKKLFFVMITNGALMSPVIARRLARSGNVLVLVSLEGGENETDIRRGQGAHQRARRTLEILRNANACYGFAAMVTRANMDLIGGDAFLDEMIGQGCSLGYFAEYVPTGPHPRPEWVLGPEESVAFREGILEHRRRKPMVLIHFPYDEYGVDNLCTGAGKHSLHISSQGDVEPCPFIDTSFDNIRRGGLEAACKSAFLRSIRDNPAIRRRQRYGCALFENSRELSELARVAADEATRDETVSGVSK